MAGIIKTLWNKYCKMRGSSACIDEKDFKKAMKQYGEMQKLKTTIIFSRMAGEFIGTIKGVLANEVPDDLRYKLEQKLKQLEGREI